MDADAAISILQLVRLYRLAGTDGCLCMSCAIQGVTINVSCRKSSGSRSLPYRRNFHGVVVRVHSRHMDAELADLRRVADEVAAQLKDEGYEIVTRLCDYEIDAKTLCAYCEKPRDDLEGYFCKNHMTEDDRNPWKHTA